MARFRVARKRKPRLMSYGGKHPGPEYMWSQCQVCAEVWRLKDLRVGRDSLYMCKYCHEWEHPLRSPKAHREEPTVTNPSPINTSGE